MSSFEFDDQRLPIHGASFVRGLGAELAAAAQSVYDDWLQDEDGIDEVYGGGGICHDVADGFVSLLSDNGVDAISVQAAVGENHIFAVAALSDGVWSIDISPYVYETGGGYVWRKRQGVVFTPEHLDVERISDEVVTGDQLSERFGE
jgi:hypothetical protein